MGEGGGVGGLLAQDAGNGDDGRGDQVGLAVGRQDAGLQSRTCREGDAASDVAGPGAEVVPVDFHENLPKM